MPIDIEIDHERRIVYATGHGTLDENDVAGFLKAAWRRDHAELTGFDALIDLTRVESIAYESAEQMQRLASLAADTDTQHAEGRIAIVAASEMTFGLSRMYQSYRQVDDRSSRTLTVVRTRELALDWLANED